MADRGSTTINEPHGPPLDEPRRGSTESAPEDARLTKRHRRIPIWVKVSVIVALVLIGVVVGSMALGASGIDGHGGGGGDHGTPPSDPTPLIEDGPSEGSGDRPAPGDPGDHTPSDGSGDHTAPDGSGDHTRSEGSRDHG